MKKFMILVFSGFIFFLGSSFLNASTTLNLSESKEGKINAALSFKEGYVGGIDLSIKVSGDVTLSSVTWDDSISGDYTRRYSFKNGIINIKITTGSTVKNLLDKNGNMKIGVLNFTNNTNNKQSYKLEIVEATIINANYKTQNISELNVSEDNQFEIKGLENKETPEESKPTPSVPDNNGNVSSNNNSTSNDNTINSENNVDGMIDEENSSNIESSDDKNIILDKDTQNSKKDNNKNTEDEDKKSISWLTIFVSAIGVIIIVNIVGSIISARKSKKFDNIQ